MARAKSGAAMHVLMRASKEATVGGTPCAVICVITFSAESIFPAFSLASVYSLVCDGG